MAGRRAVPIYVWRLSFTVTGRGMHPSALAELELRLHTYDARARVTNRVLHVRMRVVGHEGPASAVGDAAQMLRHHAANVGIEGRIDFVSAERVTATAAQR